VLGADILCSATSGVLSVLQSSLDDAVFAQAYGLALPASLGGIIVGALAAPLLLGAFGLFGALLVLMVALAGHAGLLLLRTGYDAHHVGRPVASDHRMPV
jgi:uncharacterized membrane protein